MVYIVCTASIGAGYRPLSVFYLLQQILIAFDLSFYQWCYDSFGSRFVYCSDLLRTAPKELRSTYKNMRYQWKYIIRYWTTLGGTQFVFNTT